MWLTRMQIVLIATFLCCIAVFPQSPDSSDTHETEYLSLRGYNRLVNRSFSGIVTGQKNSTLITNSASIDPANGRVEFQGSIPIGKKEGCKRLSFLTFNLGGDLISDNYTVLIQDSKLNSDVFFNVRYHIRFRKKMHINYWQTDLVNLELERQSIKKEKDFRIQSLFNDAERSRKEKFHDSISLVLLDEEIKKYNSLNGELESRLRSILNVGNFNAEEVKKLNDSIAIIHKSLESFKNDSIKLAIRVDSLEYVIVNSFFLRQILKSEINEKFDKKLSNLEYEASIAGIRYGWLSFTGGFSRKTFYSFDPSLSFENQITKNSLPTCQLGLSYNYYYENSYPRFLMYTNAGFGFIRDNNTDLLGTQEVKQNREFQSPSGDTTRSIATAYRVYSDTIEEYIFFSLFANLYLIHSSKSAAFHFFPSVKFYGENKSCADLGFGYAFSFKTKKNDKSIANAEFYLELHDIGNQLEADTKFYDRNTIGVRFTLPFYFLN